mmetsp:Transcript_10746/g.18975  ORF Transcript_10746/g.18975 Transcript_10746/m.18975 type:complete len:129 (-) Transcript_10746:54-440(-)|eukprot:CAMPEP_0184522938 /NCGR_PEP_ID=MMETSP0198_2-20121128/8582_1 /TAXON_ID=1112570 /ORGANISM="Thraustochytrium sp., Strain LLF1b" /LENGTH=128 /DNA_ID=CAMNT_0026913865 /DNA_START=177 /DNA_END=563 /DNA_ORIENTATION=+
MATPPPSSFNQEMAPPGGFKRLNVAQNVPPPKIRGAYFFLGTAALVVFGFYQVGQGNIHKRKMKLDKRLRRAAIIPFLQAEEDVRYLRERAAVLDIEGRAMAAVPGWEVGKSVYNTREWFPPGNQRIG